MTSDSTFKFDFTSHLNKLFHYPTNSFSADEGDPNGKPYNTKINCTKCFEDDDSKFFSEDDEDALAKTTLKFLRDNIGKLLF